MAQQEVAPATPSKKAKSGGGKKKNQPGRYSQLVVDTIRKLGERNGSSLAKIYGEAKKAAWFDQQNGRTYLKYSVKALVQNDTLLQVKGVGANGSFRLNKKKLEVLAVPRRKSPKPAARGKSPKPAARGKSPKPAAAAKKPAAPKKSPKKAKPAPKKSSKSPKKATGSRAGKAKKASKPKGLKAKKS